MHCSNPDFDLLFPRNMGKKKKSVTPWWFGISISKNETGNAFSAASNQYKITCYWSIWDWMWTQGCAGIPGVRGLPPCPCQSRVLLSPGWECCGSGIYWNLAPVICLSETPVCKSQLKLLLMLIHGLTPSLQPVPISTKFTGMGKRQRHNHNCDSCSLSNKAGPTLESTDFYFARKNLIQKSQHFCLFLQLAQRGGENKWKRLKKSIFDRLRIKNKIRYYGVRMAKVERDLWRWSGPNPTLKHGHSGLWPDNFRISPRMETPQAQRLS